MAAQARQMTAYPRLVSTCAAPAPPAAAKRPAPVLKLVPWSPAPEEEPEAGTKYGRRELRLHTFGETKEWHAIAAELEAARVRLNALLPNVHKFRQERALGIETPATTDDPRVTEALWAYKVACGKLFSAKAPRPRHLPHLIRATAELCGVADPAWSHLYGLSGEGPITPLELMEVGLAELYRMARLALDAPKPRARTRKAKPDASATAPKAAR